MRRRVRGLVHAIDDDKREQRGNKLRSSSRNRMSRGEKG